MREEFGIRESRFGIRDLGLGIRESRNGRRARASVRRDRSAVSSVVGFILSFALSALILIVSMFSFTSMQESVYARSAEMELKDLGNRVVAGISESIEVRRNFPNATYSRTISLPAEIKGHQYYVEATGDRVYVNSTDGKIRIASTTYKASAENVFIFGRIYSSSMYLIVSMDAGRVEIRSG
ncbi:MAG: hypothetical protein CVT47_01135 [Thermoplasmata archaeon HGW-Thermoplasmata-2]|nr:MAG: hypothetical protein CVT47_01135 [Thermoplasmata archaeon HGW-Thermoplasmata-2]